MSWYSEGHTSKEVSDQERRDENKYGPRRFYLKPGNKGQVVFVDSEGFYFQEWTFRKDGSWQNWATSPGPTSPAYQKIVKELGDTYLVGILTIINCTPWVDKDKVEHNYGMEVFPVKGKTVREKLKMKTESRNIKNQLTTIFRATDQTVNTGDDFDFLKEVNPEKLFESVHYRGKKLSDLFDDAEKNADKMKALKRIFNLKVGEGGKLLRVVPTFNYHEIYKPMADEDLLARVAGHDTPKDRDDRKASSKDADKATDQSSAVASDDIPF